MVRVKNARRRVRSTAAAAEETRLEYKNAKDRHDKAVANLLDVIDDDNMRLDFDETPAGDD